MSTSYYAVITLLAPTGGGNPADPGWGVGHPLPPHVGGGPLTPPGYVGGGPVHAGFPPTVGGGPVYPGYPTPGPVPPGQPPDLSTRRDSRPRLAVDPPLLRVTIPRTQERTNQYLQAAQTSATFRTRPHASMGSAGTHSPVEVTS
jgi:hypothetical protein